MTASPKKKERDAFGAVPLPPHFGEIDVNAPFDPERYFTVLRSVGDNPIAERRPDGKVRYGCDVFREKSKMQQRRFFAAVAWAAKQDPNWTQLFSFCREAVLKSPNGVAYLGRGLRF